MNVQPADNTIKSKNNEPTNKFNLSNELQNKQLISEYNTNESQGVLDNQSEIAIDLLENDDTQSLLGQRNRLGSNGEENKDKRFFGRKSKRLSEEITDDCIFSKIRNLELNKNDLKSETIWTSPDGKAFTDKDIYYVRKFQNVWRMKLFKRLTMKIVRAQMEFKREHLQAARRRSLKLATSFKHIHHL